MKEMTSSELNCFIQISSELVIFITPKYNNSTKVYNEPGELTIFRIKTRQEDANIKKKSPQLFKSPENSIDTHRAHLS